MPRSVGTDVRNMSSHARGCGAKSAKRALGAERSAKRALGAERSAKRAPGVLDSQSTKRGTRRVHFAPDAFVASRAGLIKEIRAARCVVFDYEERLLIESSGQNLANWLAAHPDYWDAEICEQYESPDSSPGSSPGSCQCGECDRPPTVARCGGRSLSVVRPPPSAAVKTPRQLLVQLSNELSEPPRCTYKEAAAARRRHDAAEKKLNAFRGELSDGELSDEWLDPAMWLYARIPASLEPITIIGEDGSEFSALLGVYSPADVAAGLAPIRVRCPPEW